jgi:hypothetical protein
MPEPQPPPHVLHPKPNPQDPCMLKGLPRRYYSLKLTSGGRLWKMNYFDGYQVELRGLENSVTGETS